MEQILQHLDGNQENYIRELSDFLSIPSISTSDEHKPQMQQAAEFVVRQMTAAGLGNVEVFPTAGHPIVYGEWLGAKGKPTILIYGHYDVQPAEPLELWTSEPFRPDIREGKIFARGAADDKGQVFIHFKAIEAFMKKQGSLPCNIKVIVEGEEEIGSPSLASFTAAHREMLACDVVLISDTHMMGVKQPSLVYGLRGLTYLEITVTSTKGDLHSGTFGGAIANPAQVLAEILTDMKDRKTGKVKIPGFYRDVVPLSKKERAELAKLPHSDRQYLKEIGARKAFGEKGYTTVERTGCRPTFEVNGIWGGFTGPGVKTVFPSKASAKVSMRLVAKQNPAKIAKAFAAYVKKVAPGTVTVDVKMYDNNGHPALTPIDSVAMRAATRAIRQVYGRNPYFTREGGSIPVVADFQQILQADVVLMGFGLPDDNLHAPNEKFDLVQLRNGMLTSALFYDELSRTA